MLSSVFFFNNLVDWGNFLLVVLFFFWGFGELELKIVSLIFCVFFSLSL